MIHDVCMHNLHRLVRKSISGCNLFGLIFVFGTSYAIKTQAADIAEFKKVSIEFGVDPVKLEEQSDLAQAKRFQMLGDWKNCVGLMKKEYSRHQDLQPWLLIAWLTCERELVKSDSKKNLDAKPINLARANKLWMLDPIYGNALFDVWADVELVLAKKKVEQKSKQKNSGLDELFVFKERLTKNQRAILLELIGDQASLNGISAAAIEHYQLSLQESEQKVVRDKLQKLIKIDQAGLSEKISSIQPNDPNQSESSSPLVEGGFEERLKLAERSLDQVVSIQDLVQYLHFYPAGNRSNWSMQKILEIVSSLETSSQNYGQILDVIEKLDNGRVLDVLRSLHRRQSYASALDLASRIGDRKNMGKDLAAVYYLGGRSAQLTSEYSKAKDFFEKYVQHFSGAEDIIEVYFRLGLVNFRLKNYSSANAAFEKLLSLKSFNSAAVDKYELNARYWMVRSLQQLKVPRVDQEIEFVLQKFPFSYYGLKLKSESLSGKLTWPTELSSNRQSKKEYRWLSPQEKSYRVFVKLATHGWSREARQEMSRILFNRNPEDQILMAEKAAQAGLYPLVIRWLSDAGDAEPAYRSLNFVKLGFPQVHKDEIRQEAERHGLSPLLIKSLIRQESAFDAWAVSSSQALGLMQMIPSTAKDVASELSIVDLKIPEDMFNPARNIQMGTFYLNKRIRQYQGNVPMALAAYNAGAGRLKNFFQRPELQAQLKQPSTLPEDEIWYDELPFYETSFYVKAILRNTLIYKMLENQAGNLLEQKSVDLPTILWSDLVFAAKPKI